MLPGELVPDLDRGGVDVPLPGALLDQPAVQAPRLRGGQTRTSRSPSSASLGPDGLGAPPPKQPRAGAAAAAAAAAGSRAAGEGAAAGGGPPPPLAVRRRRGSTSASASSTPSTTTAASSSSTECRQSEAWIASNGVAQLKHGRKQPFYHVLPDQRDRPGAPVTYVAHENVLVDAPPEPLRHPLVEHFFVGFDAPHGRHVPSADLAARYPPVNPTPRDGGESGDGAPGLGRVDDRRPRLRTRAWPGAESCDRRNMS